MSASFFERLGSYLLDALLIVAISSVIGVFIPSDNSKSAELTELVEKYTKGEMEADEYLNEYYELTYEIQKENWLSTVVSIGLSIMYYVVFAWYNKGSTISKKLLKLKVVDNKTGKNPTIVQMLLRSMIIYSILSSTIGLILVFTTNSKTFINVYMIVGIIELLFVVISAMFVLYRKDKRGLHDMMSGTKVIKESA